MFRGGLVFEARELFVLLNSWLESNKEEEEELTINVYMVQPDFVEVVSAKPVIRARFSLKR